MSEISHITNPVGATCYIYTLRASNDPESRPRYVGITRCLEKRRKAHASGKEPGRKGAWARKVIESGGSVTLKVEHIFCSDDTHERGIVEAEWINFFRDIFPDLLNEKGGGGGLADCSPERRERARLGQKKRYENPAAIEQNKQALLCYYAKPGSVEKSRQAAIRRYSRPSEIEKVSRIQKLRFTNPAEVEKNRCAILLSVAKSDLRNPPTEQRKKNRMQRLRWKAKLEAKRAGVPFDKDKWTEQYQIRLLAIRAKALQIYLETF